MVDIWSIKCCVVDIWSIYVFFWWSIFDKTPVAALIKWQELDQLNWSHTESVLQINFESVLQINFVSDRKADDRIFQKNFREISATDDIDKKTLAKMKKNAARDADIIWIMNLVLSQINFEQYFRNIPVFFIICFLHTWLFGKQGLFLKLLLFPEDMISCFTALCNMHRQVCKRTDDSSFPTHLSLHHVWYMGEWGQGS